MDNDTVTLTTELRAQMEDALLADIADPDSRTSIGSLSYLATLRETPDGSLLDEGHSLLDVVYYFGLIES